MYNINNGKKNLSESYYTKSVKINFFFLQFKKRKYRRSLNRSIKMYKIVEHHCLEFEKHE